MNKLVKIALIIIFLAMCLSVILFFCKGYQCLSLNKIEDSARYERNRIKLLCAIDHEAVLEESLELIKDFNKSNEKYFRYISNDQLPYAIKSTGVSSVHVDGEKVIISMQPSYLRLGLMILPNSQINKPPIDAREIIPGLYYIDENFILVKNYDQKLRDILEKEFWESPIKLNN